MQRQRPERPPVAQAPRRAARAARSRAPSGASHPAFSPDGQWITFFDGRRASRRSRPGEGGVTPWPTRWTPPSGGAAWLDDGTLVYVGPAAQRAVAGERGGRAADTGSLLDSDDGGLRASGTSAALPGGRGVLFTVCNSGCVSMQHPRARPRAPDASACCWATRVSASYLPTGHLLYVRRDGAAHGRAVRPRTISRSPGPAVPVLDERAGCQWRGLPGLVAGRAC